MLGLRMWDEREVESGLESARMSGPEVWRVDMETLGEQALGDGVLETERLVLDGRCLETGRRGGDAGLLLIGSRLLRVGVGEMASEHEGPPRGRGGPPSGGRSVVLAPQKQGCELALSRQRHGAAQERLDARSARGREASKGEAKLLGKRTSMTRVCEIRGDQSMILVCLLNCVDIC